MSRSLPAPLKLKTIDDLRDFVKHAMERYPEIVDEAVASCPTYQQHLNEPIHLQPRPVTISETVCGKLLTGAHSLSERSYKATCTLLATKNVSLATYDKVVTYLKSLDIGKCSSGHDGTGGDGTPGGDCERSVLCGKSKIPCSV